MSNNRNRGNQYERDIVVELKSKGYSDVVTSRAESRNMDNKGVDVFGHSLPVHIQAKNYTKYPDIHKLLSSELLPSDKETVIFHKKTKKAQTKFMTQGEYVYMTKECFYSLIENNINKLEIASNLAHKAVLHNNASTGMTEQDMYVNPKARVLYYKEEVQDQFNQWYDYYLLELNKK
jgi:hypothetical protein